MELTVLTDQFVREAIVDSVLSVIWTDRYAGYGEFEIYTPITPELFRVFMNREFYITRKDSEHVMIIESFEIESDAEDGNKLIVRGRSLESILERRIVWDQTIVSGNLQNGIRKLLVESILAPTDEDRKISNFVFEASTDPRITSLTIPQIQFTGDTIYDAVCSLCSLANLGWKITLNDNNQFVFKLYLGEDRSYSQDTNPFVIFSPDFDNFVNGNYFESIATYSNVAMVAGEDQGQQRRKVTVYDNLIFDHEGLTRRELYVDARDIRSTDDNNNALSTAAYEELLTSRGKEKLKENTMTKSFEGEVDFHTMYNYGDDFYMGDIIQIVSAFGIESCGRITEAVFSDNEDGSKIVPTFTIVD